MRKDKEDTMNKEYAIYPFRYMNITQRHDEGNHGPHSINVTNHSDKPWDEACQDGGRSYFEPQNDFIVEEILGLNSITTNSVRLKSVNKLFIPYKDEPDYLYVTLTHMNEDNLQEVSVGQILKKGSKILLEGTDGNATGNHFHITANLGKYYGLLQNNNGKWCYTYDKSLMPHEAFYVDRIFTTIINSKSYPFLAVPTPELKTIGEPVLKDENIDQIEVKSNKLHCRDNPGLNANILGIVNPGIYNYTEVQQSDGYDWYFIGVGWIAYKPDWADIYPKKTLVLPEDIDNSQDDIKDDIPLNDNSNFIVRFFKKIVSIFKSIFKIS